MVNKRSLTIIIVNYINYSMTIKCIKSIVTNVKHLDYEIIVVDNGSPNNSYDILYDKYKCINDISIIKSINNNGFGAGNNIGTEKAQGEYILFLNPDIEILDDAVEKMVNKIKKDKEIGLLSCKLLNLDYSIQYSCRRIVRFRDFIASRTPLSSVIIRKKREEVNRVYLMKDFSHNEIIEVDWVMGACMLIKKDLFLSVGGFSEEYFMYFEDVDLCCKVKKAGKKVIYFPDASMIHIHQQESKKRINKMSIIHFKSMCKFYYKYYYNKF